MRIPKTPGVYVREIESPIQSRFRLDITGFVGEAERGPLNSPQPIENWGQYLDIFGNLIGFGYLPYTVFSFFANGGNRCYIVRIAEETAQASRTDKDFQDMSGNSIIRLKAINEGCWGNELEVIVRSESSGDMVLTELEDKINIGGNLAQFKSVMGFCGNQTPGATTGDSIKLIHPTNPLKQETLIVDRIEYEQKQVRFQQSVENDFPEGSKILGKGFQMIFRLLKNNRFIRGEIYDNLSLNPEHERYYKRIINGDPEENHYLKKLQNGHSILVRIEDIYGEEGENAARPKPETKQLIDGSDGIHENLHYAYYTGYKDGNYYWPSLPDINGKHSEKLFGLASFEAVEEIGLVTIPDLIIPDFYDALKESGLPPHENGLIFTDFPKDLLEFDNLKNGQNDLIEHCGRSDDRFAILDGPPKVEIGKGNYKFEEWPENLQLLPHSKNAALYYPWIKHKPTDFGGKEMFIPPGGSVAGVYSRTELARGIGKAPANEMLQSIIDLEFDVSDADQAILNPKGVNCIRALPGRGIRIWGARTLSQDPMWRYINVRRISQAIIKNILLNLRWTVFEPNDQTLRDKIKAALTLFFNHLFESGVLAGTTEDEAFFVKCNAENNSPEVVNSGQVITEIGFAPAHPAEFILVTIIRTPESLSVIEQ